VRRRLAHLAVLAAAAVVVAPAPAARVRCDLHTPEGAVVDCFSGAYHGTGFLPMEETIHFRRISAAELRADPLWGLWQADAARNRTGRPCRNRNAVAYAGVFSFYDSGTFIACSDSRPNMLSGFFRVRHAYRFVDGTTNALLTRGPFSASAASDNVLELVFSDASRHHYAQPEVVLGRFTG
jgi:hypothetical protein